MRRLAQWLYFRFLGLQVKTHDQHIADLRAMLDELYIANQHIDAEIEVVTHRLLKAKEARDEAHRRTIHAFPERRRSVIDAHFPDPAPKSY